MCGIFGLVALTGDSVSRQDWDECVRSLFLLSQSRGKEAAGIAIATPSKIVVHKDSTSASAMLKTIDYRDAINRGTTKFFDGLEPYIGTIGHARLVTNGLQGIDANNQPIWRDDVVLIHNGIVVNIDEMWKKHSDISPRAEVDSEVIAALLYKYRAEGDSDPDALSKIMLEIYGETSVALFNETGSDLLLGTNTGSLFYCIAPDHTAMFFASERDICNKLLKDHPEFELFKNCEIKQVMAGTGMSFGLNNLSESTFTFDEPELAAPANEPMLQTQRIVEEKSHRLVEARNSMQRCTKCLLPETMPYIAYNTEGVCNYCEEYKSWEKLPESDLEEKLNKVRSTDGSPDCIVAFSGGRDSSYGLHVLKEEYGMTPLTFSYDWGMVTDLARRNQARLCGKLGIEHIWISADIKKKRSHIRRNVLAWLKKPDLGIIPLFMAGDKEILWHANNLMETYGINDMVFCTNELEKTIFKQGFLGIDARETTVHKPSTLPLVGKVKMLWKYGSRFAANPAYLNRSMADTMFAFFSYYVLTQNYFSLFDYMPWIEEEIDETLIGVYDWEVSPDTSSTWRIGDGTAPFYNLIYYTVAGFTEYDTFRSNQIREGMIEREKAMRLVEEENQPRWKSIREYTQMINIDFDETIRIVDRIPKLYMTN